MACIDTKFHSSIMDIPHEMVDYRIANINSNSDFCNCGEGRNLNDNWVEIITYNIKNPTGSWKDFNLAMKSYNENARITGFCQYIKKEDLGTKPNPSNY